MSTEVTVMAARMKRLSPRHRLAHLRALIRREPAGSNRRLTLVALWRDQSAATPASTKTAACDPCSMTRAP